MELKLKRFRKIVRIVSSCWREKTAELLCKIWKSSVTWSYRQLTNSLGLQTSNSEYPDLQFFPQNDEKMKAVDPSRR